MKYKEYIAPLPNPTKANTCNKCYTSLLDKWWIFKYHRLWCKICYDKTTKDKKN